MKFCKGQPLARMLTSMKFGRGSRQQTFYKTCNLGGADVCKHFEKQENCEEQPSKQFERHEIWKVPPLASIVKSILEEAGVRKNSDKH